MLGQLSGDGQRARSAERDGLPQCEREPECVVERIANGPSERDGDTDADRDALDDSERQSDTDAVWHALGLSAGVWLGYADAQQHRHTECERDCDGERIAVSECASVGISVI